MAVDFNCVKLLLWAKNLGAAFDRTVTLGRQSLICSPRRFRRAAKNFGLAATAQQIDACFERELMGPLYAEAFLQLLGATEIVSVDKSDFEGATLLHDLNDPFPEAMRGRRDFVLDGGTLEHVFHYPSALRHCLELLKPGGHFLTTAPAHCLMGHGFYQISPELFFRVFTGANGFRLRKIVLYDCSQTDAAFFQVNDPAETGRRTQLTARGPMYLGVLAQRTTDPLPARFTPQQSDYVAGWQQPRPDPPGNVQSLRSGFVGRLRLRLNPYWPYWLRKWKNNLLNRRYHSSPRLHNSENFRRLKAGEIFRERGSTSTELDYSN